MDSYLKVISQTETLATGTLKAIAVTFSFNSGITFVIHFAAPVDVGIMFCRHPRPSLHNYIFQCKQIIFSRNQLI